MDWPDASKNTSKPRYSAETSNRLLQNKNIDNENLRNDYLKLKEQMTAVTQERDDATNKLREEITRLTSLEEALRRGKEELTKKDDDRENLEAELAAALVKSKEAEQEKRDLEQQLEVLSARQTAGDQRNKIMTLERKIRDLQSENMRLSSAPERPSSRTSSIPLPKGRRPSDGKLTRLEDDIKSLRAELAEEKAKARRMESKVRKAEDDAIKLQNEKTAEEKKSRAQIEKLESALQDAKEEADLLRMQAQSSSRSSNGAELEKLSRECASALDQLKTLKVDKVELEKRLTRKTAQCEALEEKLEEALYGANDEELRQELAAAKEELAAIKDGAEGTNNRRESLLDEARYRLQDRDREIQTLQEKLRRRESSVADVEAQTRRITSLITERENIKDELKRAEQHSRYLESQLQFKKQETTHAQTQIKDLESALTKARSFNSQQQELYTEVVKSCNAAEMRVAEVERELSEVRDEMANRSTVSEAQERNRQWKEALERVGELEQRLTERGDDDPATPRADEIPLPPVLNFADQSEMDAVASLVIRLQRVRDERDTLRDSVEFLTFELQAKEVAFQHQREAQDSRLLQLLQSSEHDIVCLRQDLTSYEKRLLRSEEVYNEEIEKLHLELQHMQTMSTAAFVVLQRANSQLEMDAPSSLQDESRMQSQSQVHEETIAELKVVLEERDTSLAELNHQYSDLSRDCREKSRSLRDLQDKLDELEDQRLRLIEEVEEHSGNVRLLERELDTRGHEYQLLDEAFRTTREELHEARQEADQLRNNHMEALGDQDPESKGALERHIEELDARIVRRNEQIGIQQNDIRRLDMNLRIAENAVDEMRTEVDELRRQVGWLEDDASSVRQERNTAQRDLEATRSELDTLQYSLNKKEALFKSSEQSHVTELSALVEIISTSCVQTRLTALELDAANQRIDELEKAVEDVPVTNNADLSKLDSEDMEEARKTISAMSLAQQEAAQRLLEYALQTESLETALSSARTRGDDLVRQLQLASDIAREEVEEHIASLDEQVATLSGEVESLEERLGEAQQEIQVVLNQNGDLTNQNYDLESKIEAMVKEHEEKIKAIETKAQELEADNERIREDLDKEKQLTLHSEEELEQLRQELSETLLSAAKMDELRSQADVLRHEKAALVEQVNQLSAGVNERKLEIDGLLRRVATMDTLKQELASKAESLQVAETTRQRLESDLTTARVSLQEMQRDLSEKDATLQRCQSDLESTSKRTDELRAQISTLEAASSKMQKELYDAQQAASAAASTTVRDAEADVRIIQLETIIAAMKKHTNDLEQVLAVKTQEIDGHDDRHLEMLKERKKLVAKVDSLNRKIRMMQTQLEVGHGGALMDDMHLSESATDSLTAGAIRSTPLSQASPLDFRTPMRAPPNYVQPQASSGSARSSYAASSVSRRSPAPMPPPVYEQVAPIVMPKTFASSAPSVPLTTVSNTISAPSIPTSVSLPPSQVPPRPPVQATPPSHMSTAPTPSSSGRKRRLPEDFDPSPDTQLPAMPVLSTTPGRLRKVMADGPRPRNGFTPSRSRKNSATALDKELSNAAAAAVASLNLNAAPKVRTLSTERPLSSLASKSSRSTLGQRPPSTEPTFDKKPVSDITNAPRLAKVASTTQLSSDPVKSDGSAPRKYRTGWLNRTTKVAATKPSSTASRRVLPEEPELGSGLMPRRFHLETRQ